MENPITQASYLEIVNGGPAADVLHDIQQLMLDLQKLQLFIFNVPAVAQLPDFRSLEDSFHHWHTTHADPALTAIAPPAPTKLAPAQPALPKTGEIQLDGFDESIRVTHDGRYSIYDVIRLCGQKNPHDAWKRLQVRYSEVLAKCENWKFPGSRQRPTPVATRENILYIIGLLPGAIGSKYRKDAANVFLRYLDADPSLAQDISARQSSKSVRKDLVTVLNLHGVCGEGQIGSCTNAIYTGLFGKDAKALRKEKGLNDTSNLRDFMAPTELAAVQLAEAIACDLINESNAVNFQQCLNACATAATKVKAVWA